MNGMDIIINQEFSSNLIIFNNSLKHRFLIKTSVPLVMYAVHDMLLIINCAVQNKIVSLSAYNLFQIFNF